MKRLLVLAVAFGSCAFAAIDGVIVNGTSGKPQPTVSVSLLQPGQAGMQTLASTKSDSGGKFRFEQEPPGPKLIQATFAGVVYNHVITPGSPSTGVEVDVYESSKKPGAAHVAQDMVLLQPSPDELDVSEAVLYQNSSKTSYNNPESGTFRFFVPKDAKADPAVTITAPGGMPIKRPAEKTKEDRVFKIDYPVKPGETRFDISYVVPSADPLMFSGRILHSGPTRLVVPNGVSLEGKDIQALGQEPTTQASIYDVTNKSYTVLVKGFGALGGNDANSGEDEGEPQIEAVPPHIYKQMYLILALALGILGLGSFLLYRNGQRAAHTGEGKR